MWAARVGCAAFCFWENEKGDLTQRALRSARRVRREMEENHKSTVRNGCATGRRKTQERAGRARPLQWRRLNGTDRGADAGGGAFVWGGISADCDTAL
jgi:hypothetical protein